METKKFAKNNQSFVCDNCGKEVPAHLTSSRDHCCFCLWGKHVDINPGDRKNGCKGMLKPIGIRTTGGKSQIVYDCAKCQGRIFNIIAEDDNKESITELYSKIW